MLYHFKLCSLISALPGSAPGMSGFVQSQPQPSFQTSIASQIRQPTTITSQGPPYQPVQSEVNGVASGSGLSNTMHKVSCSSNTTMARCSE